MRIGVGREIRLAPDVSTLLEFNNQLKIKDFI